MGQRPLYKRGRGWLARLEFLRDMFASTSRVKTLWVVFMKHFITFLYALSFNVFPFSDSDNAVHLFYTFFSHHTAHRSLVSLPASRCETHICFSNISEITLYGRESSVSYFAYSFSGIWAVATWRMSALIPNTLHACARGKVIWQILSSKHLCVLY